MRRFLAAAVVLLVAACSAPTEEPSKAQTSRTSAAPSRTSTASPASNFNPYCPEPGSREALTQVTSPYILTESTDKDILVATGGARVQLVGSATITGLLRICGGGAMLVIDQPHMQLRALIQGGGATILVINPERGRPYFNPEMVILRGGGAEVVECSTKGDKDLRSCDAYLS